MPAEKTVSMSFRVSPRFRAMLQAAATREHRSLTNMLETLLYEHCERRGLADVLPPASRAEKEARR
jgi:uncharacterized protein (DUF1778 family)